MPTNENEVAEGGNGEATVEDEKVETETTESEAGAVSNGNSEFGGAETQDAAGESTANGQPTDTGDMVGGPGQVGDDVSADELAAEDEAEAVNEAAQSKDEEDQRAADEDEDLHPGTVSVSELYAALAVIYGVATGTTSRTTAREWLQTNHPRFLNDAPRG